MPVIAQDQGDHKSLPDYSVEYVGGSRVGDFECAKWKGFY